jgi:alginate O-acetyltransferase complex protein AlgJ
MCPESGSVFALWCGFAAQSVQFWKEQFMLIKLLARCGFCTMMALSLACQVLAQPTGMVGKNDFLFYRYEMAQTSDASDTQASLHLLEKMNRQLAQNGVTLALVLVPSKVRIYFDYLPSGVKLDSWTDGKYDAALQFLRAQNVAAVDLNRAFLKSPLRLSDTPLFLRLDTHWSPAGAMVAAQTIRAEIEQNAVLKRAWQATPEVAHDLTWATTKVNKRERDLVKQLPKGAPEFAIEQVLPFKVTRRQASQSGLLQEGDSVGVTAIGSSYTDVATLYPDALRYALQRDLLDISIPVLRGPWVGMAAYLQDAAFQRSRPQLLIWEIPERELRSPPNYRFREERYISDNQEWLLRASAWVQKECQAVQNPIKADVTARQATLEFETPLQPLDYVQFTLPASHAHLWQLEALNRPGEKKAWSQTLAVDDLPFTAKLTLPALPGGVTQLRLQAEGIGDVRDWRVCRLPAFLLEKN